MMQSSSRRENRSRCDIIAAEMRAVYQREIVGGFCYRLRALMTAAATKRAGMLNCMPAL
jgi:hypothetical protein